jgi:hypothetical protein
VLNHDAENLHNSIGRALTRVQNLQIPTRWSNSVKSQIAELPELSDPEWSGGRVLIDSREQKSLVTGKKSHVNN